MRRCPMNIIYMGTSAFALPPLAALSAAGHRVQAVYTGADKRGNRGRVEEGVIKRFALENGLPLRQPSKLTGDDEILQELSARNPDFIVVASYGHILPPAVLRIPRYGCLNLHASLLPLYRGASPVQHAILNGDKESGVSLMRMEKGLDTGAVYAQARVKIGMKDYPQLLEELAKIGATLITENLEKIADGTLCARPQEDGLSTYAGLIKKTDGEIDFSSMDVVRITRMIRAFKPWPGVSCLLNGMRIKILEAKEIEASLDDTSAADSLSSKTSPGTVLSADEAGIAVSCNSGTLLITAVQAPGKKAMRAADYLRGHRLEKGTVLS